MRWLDASVGVNEQTLEPKEKGTTAGNGATTRGDKEVKIKGQKKEDKVELKAKACPSY